MIVPMCFGVAAAGLTVAVLLLPHGWDAGVGLTWALLWCFCVPIWWVLRLQRQEVEKRYQWLLAEDHGFKVAAEGTEAAIDVLPGCCDCDCEGCECVLGCSACCEECPHCAPERCESWERYAQTERARTLGNEVRRSYGKEETATQGSAAGRDDGPGPQGR